VTWQEIHSPTPSPSSASATGRDDSFVVERLRRTCADRFERVEAEREAEQMVSEHGIACQHRPVEVRSDESSQHEPVGAVPVPNAGLHHAEGLGALVEHGPTRVVLEAGERAERSGVKQHLSDCPWVPRRNGVDGQDPEAVGTEARDREAPTEDLESGTHREDDHSVANGSPERPVRAEPVDRELLRTVLSSTNAVEVGRHERGIAACFDELDLDVSELGTTPKDERVAAVAVGSEEIGIDRHDAKHLAHLVGDGPQGRERRVVADHVDLAVPAH
jgi:hypothetical protein